MTRTNALSLGVSLGALTLLLVQTVPTNALMVLETALRWIAQA